MSLGLKNIGQRVRLWQARRHGPPFCAVCGETIIGRPDVAQQTHQGKKVYHRRCFPELEALLNKAGFRTIDGRTAEMKREL